MPTPLTEHIADWRAPALEIDSGQRLVKNVALTGPVSRNGYRYSESALREAAPLYDRKPVFLDHPRAPGKPLDRSARDLIGSIVNPRYEDGRLRGDIQALDTDAGRTFLALAHADHPAVGMSHIVLADKTEDTVERIHEVISVDAVVFPATTQTLREHTEDDGASSLPSPPLRGRGAGGEGDEAQQISELNEHADSSTPPLPHSSSPPLIPPWPAAVERLLPLDPGHPARLAHGSPPPFERAGPPQLPSPPVERAGSPPLPSPPPPPPRGRGAGGEGDSSPRANLLARLPPAAITPLFEQQLREAPDEPARQALLEDRFQLLERLTPKTTSPQRLHQPSTPTDDQILQTLRRR